MKHHNQKTAAVRHWFKAALHRGGYLAMAAILAIAAMPHPTVKADAGASESPFYVSANLPENQMGTHGYFNLRMHPGDVQTISIDVFNESDEEIKVSARVTNASTASNGAIDYKTPDIQDETMLYALSDIASIPRDTLDIPAYGSKTLFVDLQMPEDSFDGAILGGLVFALVPDTKPEAAGESEGSPGVAITNLFNSVLGVVLTETDRIVLPDFEALGVRFEIKDFSPVLVHSLRNKQAAIVKDMLLEIEIYSESVDAMVLKGQAEVSTAPNSVLPYALAVDIQDLTPGNYVSHITAETEGLSWAFEVPFVLTEEDLAFATEVQLEPVVEDPPENILPAWVFPLIAGLVLIIICMLFIMLKKNRSRR